MVISHTDRHSVSNTACQRKYPQINSSHWFSGLDLDGPQKFLWLALGPLLLSDAPIDTAALAEEYEESEACLCAAIRAFTRVGLLPAGHRHAPRPRKPAAAPTSRPRGYVPRTRVVTVQETRHTDIQVSKYVPEKPPKCAEPEPPDHPEEKHQELLNLPALPHVAQKLCNTPSRKLRNKILTSLGNAPLAALDCRIRLRFNAITSFGLLVNLARDCAAAHSRLEAARMAQEEAQRQAQERYLAQFRCQLCFDSGVLFAVDPATGRTEESPCPCETSVKC